VISLSILFIAGFASCALARSSSLATDLLGTSVHYTVLVTNGMALFIWYTRCTVLNVTMNSLRGHCGHR